MEDLPRRNQINKMTPAELAIYNAIRAIDQSGADPKLTDAIRKLQEAFELVADFTDKK